MLQWRRPRGMQQHLSVSRCHMVCGMLAKAQASFPCLNRLFLKGSLRRKQLRPPSHKNSNNPLAGEPETENDATRKFIRLVHDFTSVEAAAPATTKRIYSNDQHVDTCRDAWRVDDGGRPCGRGTCLLASAE